MKELRINAAARREFDDDIDWYAAKSKSIAERFEAAVDERIEAIRRHPQLNPKWDASRRFTLVHGFPYYIVYRVSKAHVEIVAIFHSSRDTSDWTDR